MRGADHPESALRRWVPARCKGRGTQGGYDQREYDDRTDDFGYRAVVDRVSLADLHATVLHQLGLDYRKLWFPRHGREERLTDVAKPQILTRLLA